MDYTVYIFLLTVYTPVYTPVYTDYTGCDTGSYGRDFHTHFAGALWGCSGDVLRVFWGCSGDVLGMFWGCSGDV
jgi:hypothetical protein